MSDFSHDGFFLHPDLRDKRKPVSTEWLKGPKITAENLKKGTGCVELLDRPEWVKSPNGAKGAILGGAAKSAQNSAIMGFGKYASRLMVDVEEEDNRYFQWCLENVKGFEKKWKSL